MSATLWPLTPRRLRPARGNQAVEARSIMVMLAIAFVIGGTLGAVLTAALIASNQRSLFPEPDLPMRSADRWIADAVSWRAADYDSASANRDDMALARRLGREASATARERAIAARRAMLPTFGITMRVRR
jgi:hypothetical protein